MELEFSGEIIHWRGPAPFLFVPVPPGAREDIRSVAREVSYGWGVIPVTARIGGTTFTTSLFPRDGGYLVPVKVAVQRVEEVDLGDTVTVHLTIDV
ncbi:MAG: DUF1905 domain-containing protein [Actinomycetaceae bacterium]